jgi:cellulose/xylan binding protein with CBM9 domain
MMVRWRGLFTLAIAASAAAANFSATNRSANDQLMYSSNAKIDAKRISSDFLPDADLSKDVWKRANWVEFDHAISGKPSYPEAATRVASLWSGQYIYFAFSCKYDVLNIFDGEDIAKERWELWNRDVAEVFLNPQPARFLHYYEFEVAPNNQWVDLEITSGEKPAHNAAWNSDFTHATRIDAGRHVWTAEMRIPLAAMNAAGVKAGAEWRANFFRAAGPGDDTQRKFLAWSTIPEGKTFHVPRRFGILRLLK